MNHPWSRTIARLAKAKSHDANLLDQAQSELRAVHSSIHKQSQSNEKALIALEKDYGSAKQELATLADEMRSTQPQTKTSRTGKAHSLEAALAASEARVGEIEQALLALKGVVSHNRYRLFQLSQQLDTLSATSQLHKAHGAQNRGAGVVTALDALASFSQRQACNDD